MKHVTVTFVVLSTLCFLTACGGAKEQENSVSDPVRIGYESEDWGIEVTTRVKLAEPVSENAMP